MLPRYNELVSFDPDEFITAFAWAMNAASGFAEITDPTTLHFTVIDEDGTPVSMHLGDVPLVRISIAMKERYADVSREKYHSATFRIWAVLDLIRSGKLATWVRPVPEEPDKCTIADAVPAVAAVLPLNKKLQFPVREFLRRLRELDPLGET